MLDSRPTPRRRPSAAMAVAVTALFVALGGVGYAAFSLPPNSVGRAQIRNNAVNYRKIRPGSVGFTRINPNSVQARIKQDCKTGSSAITAIDVHGQPTCKATRPAEFDTSNAKPEILAAATSNTAVASEALNGASSYLVSADPYISVAGTAGANQHVVVSCTLAAGNGSSTRSVSFDLTAGQETESTTIPLQTTAGPSSTNEAATVACNRTITPATGAAPVASVTTAIYAVETSSNTTEPNTTVPYAIAPSRRTK